MSMLMLTICGSFLWKDLGKAIGEDIERATGQVSESDLETQFTPMGDQQKSRQTSSNFIVYKRPVCIFSVLKHLTHSHGFDHRLFL